MLCVKPHIRPAAVSFVPKHWGVTANNDSWVQTVLLIRSPRSTRLRCLFTRSTSIRPVDIVCDVGIFFTLRLYGNTMERPLTKRRHANIDAPCIIGIFLAQQWKSARGWSDEQRLALDRYMIEAKHVAEAKQVLAGAAVLVAADNRGDKRRKRKIGWAIITGDTPRDASNVCVKRADSKPIEVAVADIQQIQVRAVDGRERRCRFGGQVCRRTKELVHCGDWQWIRS